MLRFVTVLAAMVAAVCGNPQPYVLELDLSPEEALKYINNPPFQTPQLAGRTAVLPLVKWSDPRFRAADAGPTLGHYWKNGHEIENTEDYVDEIYNARQYHGQDGLGAFGYGYETPESSKVENRARSGDVTGSYQFKSGDKIINVRYWSDKDGFHQEDDRPKELTEPVQEAEDVRLARLEHERAWQAAAAAARENPDPQGEYYGENYQGAGSEPAGTFVGAPIQEGQYNRESKAYNGLPSQQSTQALPNYLQQFQNVPQYKEKLEEPEPTGPPRGFFYEFTYPVDIIKAKSELSPGYVNPGKPIDHDTVEYS